MIQKIVIYHPLPITCNKAGMPDFKCYEKPNYKPSALFNNTEHFPHVFPVNNTFCIILTLNSEIWYTFIFLNLQCRKICTERKHRSNVASLLIPPFY